MPILIIIPILFLVIYFFIRRSKSIKVKVLTQTYESLIPKDSTYEFKNIDELIEEEHKENYDSVYLVHGTFVGNDPFDLIGLLEKAFPALRSTIIEKIKKQIKNGQDYLIKDFGNFHKDITGIVEENLENESDIHFFNWSSSNHHYARLKGTFDLLKDIASKHNKHDRILLFGHSHAGQIFALLTLLVNDHLISNQIFTILGLEKSVETEIKKHLKKLKSIKFDFVTLGTPVRYSWNLSNNTNLLHIINHRGNLPQGGSLTSSIACKSGDYIQQWAITGSDILSTNVHDREMNKELDLILGNGCDLEQLKRNIKFKKRLHHKGHHFLVDFKENSSIPNPLKTIFGHAVYTQKKSMVWILNQSIQYFKDLDKK